MSGTVVEEQVLFGKVDRFKNLISSLIIFTLVDSIIKFSIAVEGSLMAIIGQLHAHLIKIKVESNASFSITLTVRSFILWHSALIPDYQPTWLYFLFLFYVSFEIFLYLRPEKSQI